MTKKYLPMAVTKADQVKAGVAYLASLWFSSPDGDPVPEKAATA